MKAASTFSVRDGHAIVKAGEFIAALCGACTSPSLAARKTLALLIAKAAGEAWRPGSHVIAKRAAVHPQCQRSDSRHARRVDGCKIPDAFDLGPRARRDPHCRPARLDAQRTCGGWPSYRRVGVHGPG